MPMILQSTVKRLMGDIGNVERDLKVLFRSYAHCAREPQNNNLGELIEDFRRLEWTMNMIFLDCMSLGRKYWKEHNMPAIETLHQTFGLIECVFDDIKTIRKHSNAGLMNPSQLQELLIDWVRFKGSVFQIHKIIQKSRKRRKRYPSPKLNGRREQE